MKPSGEEMLQIFSINSYCYDEASASPTETEDTCVQTVESLSLENRSLQRLHGGIHQGCRRRPHWSPT